MAVTYSYLAGVGCHLIILVDRSVCEENLIHAASLHQHMFQFHWLLIGSHSEARGQLSGRAQLTPSHFLLGITIGRSEIEGSGVRERAVYSSEVEVLE